MLIAEQIRKLIVWKRNQILCFLPELSALSVEAIPAWVFFQNGYLHVFFQVYNFPVFSRAVVFIFSKSSRRSTALSWEEMFT